MTTKRKAPYSLRLSPAARKLMAQLSTKLGIGKSAVVEVSLRALAKREGFDK